MAGPRSKCTPSASIVPLRRRRCPVADRWTFQESSAFGLVLLVSIEPEPTIDTSSAKLLADSLISPKMERAADLSAG